MNDKRTVIQLGSDIEVAEIRVMRDYAPSSKCEQKRAIKHIESRLRSLLGKRDMLNKDMAQKAGLSPSAINQILSGISRPSLETLIKIANSLKVSLDWLCTGDE
ncbi:MAG: helix-turn-helix transcriptional regulator [Dehalococcoidales bacterium]|nr:helix-turn-helix transcriptional regulator [Dehalococcoidales bacterium]